LRNEGDGTLYLGQRIKVHTGDRTDMDNKRNQQMKELEMMKN
jgi:hypothetical protein